MHAEADLDADEGVAVAPVYDTLRNEVFVGDEDAFVIAGDDFGVAGGHVIDPAECADIGQLYDVARFDGAIHEEQHAGEEVRNPFLQAETNPETNGTAEDGEEGEVYAGARDADQEREDDEADAGDFGDQDL